MAGTGAAEAVVHFTGRSRKAGILPFLASVAFILGLVLLVMSLGERFECATFRHNFDDKEPAWFYLVFVGIFGGLAGTGSSLFWYVSVSRSEEAREQRRR